MNTFVSDIYADECMHNDFVMESFKEISKQVNRIQELITIKASIETFGLDPAVMALINKDNQLVNELKLTENDLNKSQEGLSDVFNSGLIKKIIDGIKWLVEKIIEGVKWVWNKLLNWANANKISTADLQRAANNWDKLPDNATLQPPDSANPDIPWTNIPDFKECKNRLELSKRLCEDFINKFLSPLSEFSTAYITEYAKNPVCAEFYNMITSDRFKDLRNNLMLSTQFGNKGNILCPAMQKAYQEYIERNKISSSWSHTEIARIAEVRVKKDLGVRYKGEFNEVGTTIADIEKTINKSKANITALITNLTKIRSYYDTYAKNLLAHAKENENQGNDYAAQIERNTANTYNTEVSQLTDLLNTIVLVNSILQRYILIGTVNKLGLKELLDDMMIMFK